MISVLRVREAVPSLAAVSATELQRMIDRARDLVETLTGRYFGTPETITEYLNGTAGYRLWLSDKAQLVDSEDYDIRVEERPYPKTDVTEITAFEVQQGTYITLLQRTDGTTWQKCQQYLVTYTRGYLVDAGPRDIEQLLIDLIAVRQKLVTLGMAMRSETIGGYSYTRFGESDLDAVSGGRDIIRNWMRPKYAVGPVCP